MRDNQQSSLSRQSDRDVSIFVYRVVWIAVGNRQWVVEDSRRFRKGRAVLRKVVCRFSLVPAKFHVVSITCDSSGRSFLRYRHSTDCETITAPHVAEALQYRARGDVG